MEVVVVAILAALTLGATGLALFALLMRHRAERIVPPDGPRVSAGGHEIHYTDSDPNGTNRPTIVLVHGLGGQLRNLTHSLAPLLEDDFRVLSMDRPGSGYSRRAKGIGGTLEDQADAVVAFIEALGLDRPIVVGHSLGGATAIALAMQRPEAVRGIVLVAPVTDIPDEVPSVFAPLVIRQNWRRHLTAWTLAVPMTMANRKRALSIVFAPDAVPDDFAVRGGAALGMRPSNFHAATTDLTGLADSLPALRERYGEISVPVAIIHGTHDVITPFERNAERQAPRLRADLKVLEGRGHMIPITAAPDVAAFIREKAADWHAPQDVPA